MRRKILIILGLIIIPLLGLLIPTAHADAPDKADDTPEVLERIAMCESKNVEYAKNPHSSAAGRFQFLKSSWQYYGKMLWGD